MSRQQREKRKKIANKRARQRMFSPHKSKRWHEELKERQRQFRFRGAGLGLGWI